MDGSALHDLLSGRRRDLFSSVLRSGLWCLSGGYFLAMILRNAAYNRNWLRIHRVTVPVISLGNITTGGTGKTPMAAWISHRLQATRHSPGLLSRGYRSFRTKVAEGCPEIPSGNDEKLVLDRLCPGVPHLQQRDRVSAAKRLVDEHGCDRLVLDDGFQHRQLHRDLDIVLVDALQPWGFGSLLPCGLLREPLAALRRADVIVLTRADQITSNQRGAFLQQLAKVRGTDECVEVAFTARSLIGLSGDTLPLSAIRGRRVFAFCGVGNPQGFIGTVSAVSEASDLLSRSSSPEDPAEERPRNRPDQESPVNLTLELFPDHHHYDLRDIQRLSESANAARSEIVLTTLKDCVKLQSNAWNGPPLYAVDVAVEFLSGRELLEIRLQELT